MRISDWSSDVCSSDLHMYGNADACLTCCALTDAKIIHMILLISQHVLRPIKTTRYGPKCLCKACLQAGACAVHGSQICGGIFRSEDRRVGTECVSTCKSRWSTNHWKKKIINKN